MADHLVRILTADGYLRACACSIAELVEQARRRQHTDPTASVALGRLAGAAALLGSLLKGEQRLALMIEGNGPLQKLHAETDAAGHLRAMVKVPRTGLPPRDGRYDVAGAVGRAGFLTVVKDLGLKEPYRGMVQLVGSEIAEDLAYYLTTSEQIPSSVGLGVCLGPEAEVLAAGGFLVQAMPGCPDELVVMLEERLRSLPPVTELLRAGSGPRGILKQIFADLPYREQGELPLRFRCNCSYGQILGLLRALGPQELRELAAQPEGTVVSCEFCRRDYPVTADALTGLAAQGAAGN